MFRHPSQVARQRVDLLAVLALTCASGADAQSGDADWQMYGGVTLSKEMGGEQRSFFDAAGVVRRSDGHIEVWTKSLSVKDMDRVQGKPGDLRTKIINRVLDKQTHGYLPPFSVATSPNDKNSHLQTSMDEVTADMADIEPSARIMYELDCSNRLLRELSIQLTHNGKSQYVEKPADWKHVPPETSGFMLLKLLCAQHKDNKSAAP